MSLRTAREHFDEALRIAEQENDAYRQSIAAGLRDLSKSISSALTQMKAEIDSIKRSVK